MQRHVAARHDKKDLTDLPMKHLLSIEQLSREEIERILRRTADLKTNRGKISAQPLAGQTWALIFSNRLLGREFRSMSESANSAEKQSI